MNEPPSVLFGNGATPIHKFWEPSAECYKYYNYLDKFFIEQLFPIHLPVRVIRDSTGYGDTSLLPSEYLQKLQ